MDIMKRYVFLLTVFMAIHINAQVLSDSRQWVGWEPWEWPFDQGYAYSYLVKGDTLVNEDDCKKVYLDARRQGQGAAPAFLASAFEDGNRLYAYKKGSGQKRLIYDFGLQPGDMLACRYEGDFFWIEEGQGSASEDVDELQVMAVDIIEVEGKPLRRLHLVQRHFELVDGVLQEGTYQPDIYWVEGIGSSYGLMSPCANLRTGAVAHLLKEVVESDGHVSFTAADFLQNITPVKKVSRPVSGKDFYTPDGRRVVGIPSKGICIERTCGTVRKVILK